MSLNNNFPLVPERVQMTEPYWRLMMKAINRAIMGKMNCTGVVTLTPSASTTSITDNNCLANSVVLLQPTTAHAAAELVTAYITPADGSFVVNHANNSQADRTFRYAIIG